MAEDRSADDDAVSTRNIPVDAAADRAWAVDDVTDPASLGRFEILGRLGKGAMGVVYEAMDPASRSAVAIKMITRMSPEGVYRFKREFRTLAKFQHRNVVSLYELALHDGQLFYTMELVRGETFIRFLCGEPKADDRKTYRPCRDYAKLREALKQLAAGVDAIHRAGILHRDIKPSNLLVTAEGRVVILDFGLVRHHQLDAGASLTDDGAVLGTPLYMSPEQAVGGKVGPASDWYGVGAVMYQALAGRAPFQGIGVLGLLAAKKDETPPPPSSRVSGIPPELDRLCMDLLATEPEDRPSGEEIIARLGSLAVPSAIEPDVSMRGVFLGRDAQLGQLHRLLAERRTGRPVVACIDGLSGMGKTALVQEFLESVARRPDTVVLMGKCSEREWIPYKALDSVMDALSDHLRSLPSAADVRAVLPRDIHAVARLFPVLMSVPAVALAPRRDRSEAMDPKEARGRAFAALRDFLGRLADDKRVVISIDDLQWTDSDSVALLENLLRHNDAPGLMILGTFREGADAGEGPLARLLASLQSEGSPVLLERIHVGPLAQSDAVELAGRLLGPKTKRSRVVAEEIARESEGSPFFVEELVRYAKRAEEESDPGETESGVKLDDVIRHRLSRLPEAARRLLDVIAVAGGRVALGIASRVAMGDTSDRSALDQLRAEHLVRAHGPSEADSVEIYHARIRETTLRDIGPQRLPQIHLEIGRALEATGDADAVALSHHFRQAGEDQLATQHTIAAAEQAAASLAFDRAAELYKIALELGVLPDEEVPQVEANLGAALANAGRLYESAAAYLRASRGGEDREHFEWTRLAAEHLLGSGHTEEGRTALDKVLGAVGISLPASDARAIGSIIKHRLILSMRGLKYRLRHASDISTGEIERVDACWTAARGLLFTDGIVAADFHGRGLRYALGSGDPVRICRALGLEAQMMTALGADKKLDKAHALIDEAAELAEKADSDYARGLVEYFRGHVWIGAGEWTKCREHLETAAEIFRSRCTGVSQEIAVGAAHSAVCQLYLGHVRELSETAHALLEEALERANPYVEGFARGIIGNVVMLAADRVDAAREQLTIYRRDAPKRFQPHRINYIAQSAALMRYVGEYAQAWASVEEEWPALHKLALFRSPHPFAELWLWRGACALAAATESRAPEPLVGHALEAAAKVAKHPSAFGRAYGAITRAGALALRGDEAGAVEACRQAIELFEAAKMTGFSAAARARLGALVGGDEGTQLRDAAAAYYAAQGVKRPERFIAMNAPGFARD